MSRYARIARAVTIGYPFQVAVALTALLLTPFLLGRLGVDDYGRWLVLFQVLAMFGLLDLGVTAVLPREVARTSGTKGAISIAEVVGQALWLVILQTPLVCLIAGGVWLGVTAKKPELASPLAVILIAFVLQYPCRIFAAVLTGLQDVVFCGILQVVSWLTATVLTVALVFAGWSLTALATGWAAGQLMSCLLAWWRLRLCFPEALGRTQWPGWSALYSHVGASIWTTLRQLSQFLLNGSELLVLDYLVGPAAVVVYSCTVRLISLLNNQPYILATAATPAIAQLQGIGDRDGLWRACRALGLGMILLSGAFAIVVLASSGAFVPLWVGADKYAGPTLVLAAVVVMVARHWVFTLSQIVFALGYDSRLGFTAIADGVLTVVATYAWVSFVGVVGVPLGSLTSLVFTNGLIGILTLASAEGVSPARVVLWAMPWLLRFLVVAIPVAAASFFPDASKAVVAAGLLIGGLVVYVALTLPLLGREPLRGYRDRVIAAVRGKIGLPAIST